MIDAARDCTREWRPQSPWELWNCMVQLKTHLQTRIMSISRSQCHLSDLKWMAEDTWMEEDNALPYLSTAEDALDRPLPAVSSTPFC